VCDLLPFCSLAGCFGCCLKGEEAHSARNHELTIMLDRPHCRVHDRCVLRVAATVAPQQWWVERSLCRTRRFQGVARVQISHTLRKPEVSCCSCHACRVHPDRHRTKPTPTTSNHTQELGEANHSGLWRPHTHTRTHTKSRSVLSRQHVCTHTIPKIWRLQFCAMCRAQTRDIAGGG
jgi:hypothetical protein